MNTQKSRMLRGLFPLACVLIVVLASACASERPERARERAAEPEVETLGFLEDYAQLSPGRPGQASLIYIDGQADFSAYDAIVVEPVVAWAAPGSAPVVETQKLARNLDEALRRELALEYELVDRPRAGALRLRAALASEAGSHVVLEVEILDASSGARVVAAVDHRALQTAGPARQTDAWAVLIRNRLATFRRFDAAARARGAGESSP